MSDSTDDLSALGAAAGITFVGDGWNVHQVGTTEGGGVWFRGLATYTNDGTTTVVVAGSQGNMFSAAVTATSPGAISSFTALPSAGALGTVPAYKWFDGVSFAQDGTLGFATGYHGLVLETTDGGQSWTDLTNPGSMAVLQADIYGIAISPNATVDSDGTTPGLVVSSLAPDAAFYPPLHYGVIGPDGTIAWAASALSYNDGTTTVPLSPTYYDRILQSVYLSSSVVLASGNVNDNSTQTDIDPLLISTDGGIDFSTIPFPQEGTTTIRQLHEIVVDPMMQGIVWGAGPDGIIVRADLSSYLNSGTVALFNEIKLPGTIDDIDGLAISPNDQTIIAISEHGTVYLGTDPAGINNNDGSSVAWTIAATLPIPEVWSAQFINDDIVVAIGEEAPQLNNGNTIQTPGTDEMLSVSTNAGLDWTNVNLVSQWSTQQTALTGTIEAFTSGTTDYLMQGSVEIPITQDTLLLSGATMQAISAAATVTPAMIILPNTESPVALTLDTMGNDVTLQSVLSGSGELLKIGAGALTLMPMLPYNPDGTSDVAYQANFQSGGIEIDAGMVVIDLDAELGVPNANKPGNNSPEFVYPATGDGTYALTLNGGTLQANQDLILQTIYDGGELTRPVILGSSGGALDPNGHTLTLPGSISGNGGLVEVGTGTLVLDAINNFAGGITVQGGTLGLQLSGALPSGTLLDVTASGTVLLDGTDQTAQAIAGASGGEIEINGGVLIVDQTSDGPDIDFAGSSGQLTFASSDPLVLTDGLNSTILGFNPAAQINLIGITYAAGDTPQYADGTLTIDDSGGTLAVLHFDPTGTYNFALEPDGGDTVALTDLACFAQGTMIATRRGDVPVEHLRVGETVITADGGELPVVWVGYRHVACRHHPHPQLVSPVRVRAHAFGKERPSRDLFLSPDHAVFVADVLIPIKYLINGSSVAQVTVEQITYYHIELPQHNVLLADGLPTESLLPSSDRSNFANGNTPIRLFPDFNRTPPGVWEAYGYAPLIVGGPILDAARRTLRKRVPRSTQAPRRLTSRDPWRFPI